MDAVFECRLQENKILESGELYPILAAPKNKYANNFMTKLKTNLCKLKASITNWLELGLEFKMKVPLDI